MTAKITSSSISAPVAEYPVRAFGAAGDGAANDTVPVQRALDICHASGGGRVSFAPGTYVCGTLDLKSHTELFLASGSILKGSPRREDYKLAGNAPYNPNSAHLIRAVNAEHIAIRGAGVIDGNGQAFFGPPNANLPLRRFQIKGWRPSHMLSFCECRDVVLEGVHLLNAATYTVWPFACERMRIEGVTIRNPPETPNGDGIDPTACRDVLINQCFIDTGDDCIALYSNPDNGTFGARPRPCENIIISNCVLRSACTAVRLGPHGDGPIRHCLINDLVIAARVGISMHVFALGERFAGTIYDSVRGAPIEDIQIRNISIDAGYSPLFIQIHPDSQTPAGIRDVSLSHAHMRSPGAVCIVGCKNIPVERMVLDDLAMHAEQPVSAFMAQVPDPIGKLAAEVCPRIPCAFFLRHVRGERLGRIWIYGAGKTTGRAGFVAQKKNNRALPRLKLQNRFLKVILLPALGGRILQVYDRQRDQKLIPEREDAESVGYEEYIGHVYRQDGHWEPYAVIGRGHTAQRSWVQLRMNSFSGFRIERKIALRGSELHINSVLINCADCALPAAMRMHARWLCDPRRDGIAYADGRGKSRVELLSAFVNRDLRNIRGAGLAFHFESLGVRLEHDFDVNTVDKASVLAHGNANAGGGQIAYDLFVRSKLLAPRDSLRLRQVYRISNLCMSAQTQSQK